MPDPGRWTSNGGDPSLNEINRADRFFEALAAKQPVYSTDREEAELAFLFAEFRDDVRDAPVTASVTFGDAAEALRGGLAKNRGSRRGFAVVGSVAAAMLCIGGFGTAVYGAGPGDSLYGMRTTIFGQQEQTRDDQVSLASAQLQQVQQLIDQGQWEQAQDKLVEVSSAVQGVDQVEQKQQLVEQWNALTYKVVEQNPAATLPPGEPLPALPSSPLTWLPVPVVEATTSATTSDTSSDATTSSSTSPSTTPSGSETTVTSPSDSAVPPGSSPPPSEGSTAPSTSSPVAEPAPTSVPSTSSATATTTTAAPTTTTATTAAPTTTTTTAAPTTTTTTAAPTTTTTTTTTVPPRQSEASQQSSTVSAPPVRSAAPGAEAPARVAPSAAVAPTPAAPAPAQASEQPPTSTAHAEPTTTTVVPPA